VASPVPAISWGVAEQVRKAIPVGGVVDAAVSTISVVHRHVARQIMRLLWLRHAKHFRQHWVLVEKIARSSIASHTTSEVVPIRIEYRSQRALAVASVDEPHRSHLRGYLF
jgi:hypothetical protein